MYKLLFSEQAVKEINSLDRSAKLLLEKWIKKHLVNCDNPRAYGKELTVNKKGLWRYRIGDYRLICSIEDDSLIILALSFGHRSEIYKN